MVVVSLLTVGLWCFNSKLQSVTGEMGVIGCLPLVAFFGFGILNKARLSPTSEPPGVALMSGALLLAALAETAALPGNRPSSAACLEGRSAAG